ncbi:MAG: DNA-3-methyladenine glycosylase [Pirellulaceae bacterium]|jgi:DNA-3-methyladenine glycosylase|nr:DNA-3-methyladenine glycosylase [Pirellulaceae bacterium]MDP7019051.1 DNA-3-methyladenine glycosylase [Pirellulaceae bacterium]
MSSSDILPTDFYRRDVVQVARDLIGKQLRRELPAGIAGGRIVETEAYRGADDPASHSYRGKTPRNEAMFGPPGRAYVYTIHARFCLNAVAQDDGSPCGVLIRAIEPQVGVDLMEQLRGDVKHNDLTRGPARLCEALDIDRQFDAWPLDEGRELWIEEAVEQSKPTIAVSPRIGVSQAQDRLWRFFVNGNRYVSGPRKYHSEDDGPPPR